MADETMTTEEGAAQAVAEAAAPEPSETPAEPARPNALATVLQKLQGVPDAIRSYLLSDELAALHKKVFDDHGVSQDDRDLIYWTELQTFFGDIPLADFPDRAWIRLDWPDEKEELAAAVITDVLGLIFLPAQAYLGDVAGLITELGGDLKKYPEKQLEMRRVSFRDGAREIAEATGIEGLDEDSRKRLAHIIESRLRVVRDDMETKEMLMKSKKTGGLEMSEENAARVLSILASKMRMVAFSEAVESPAEKKSPGAGPAGGESPARRELSAIEIKKVYSGTPEEQEGIAKRLQRFTQVTEKDPVKMRDAYYQVLFPPDLRPTDPLYVVAGLLAMADGDQISEAVDNDERFANIVGQYLADKGMQADVARYPGERTDPRYMNMLFQLILRGIAGYDEGESARLGLRVINALKKQGYDRYADLVAFDMEKGAFAWKDAVEF